MTPNELLIEAQKLTPTQQIRLILQLLHYWLTTQTPLPKSTPQHRVPNLHPGACIFGDDFDDPLPDRFWLGEE